MMKHRHQETADRVEFRWRQHEEEFARRLAEAANEAGHSPSDHARELLKDALTASDRIQLAIESLHQEVTQLLNDHRLLITIKEGVRTIHENIYQFRDNLAVSVIKILIDAGKLDARTAKNWASEALDAESSG
jgi:hypothetical protein